MSDKEEVENITKFTQLDMNFFYGFIYECSFCKAENVNLENLDEKNSPPNYCSNCGRKNELETKAKSRKE